MRKIKAENVTFRGGYSIVNGADDEYYLAEYKNVQHVIETLFDLINKINRQIKELKLREDTEFVDKKQLTNEDKKVIENIVKRMAMTEVARYMKYLNQEKLKPSKEDFKKQYPEWLSSVCNNTPFSIEECKKVYDILEKTQFLLNRNQLRLEAVNRMANECAVSPQFIAQFLVRYIKTIKRF